MATRGNAVAGSLAASLQAAEIAKLLAGDRALLAAGREVLLDAACHSLAVSRLVRSRACRFSHERWEIEHVGELTLREALALGGPGAVLSVPGSAFVSRLVCSACDCEEEIWRLEESLDSLARRCPRCGVTRSVRGFDLSEQLSAKQVPALLLGRPLEERGLRGNDVFGVEGAHGRFLFALGAVPEAPAGSRVVIAGLGNIGSFLAPLVARMPAVSHVVLSDPDTCEADQIAGHDIPLAAAGRSKVLVQAERLHAIRPDLRVEAFAAPAERLPMGLLAGAITASCLDSRVARLRLAARSWRAASPFVDAAVGGGPSLLVRTTVYLPEDDAPCLECGFDDSDYAALEQVLPCTDPKAA